ncbi:hypothetical protein CLAIMM_06896 isoform 2 [Cladophialophora immunda]|nr:hypothetical protein CLAIMM_06896 isoform 2 [Cladophialophora immunda]
MKLLPSTRTWLSRSDEPHHRLEQHWSSNWLELRRSQPRPPSDNLWRKATIRVRVEFCSQQEECNPIRFRSVSGTILSRSQKWIAAVPALFRPSFQSQTQNAYKAILDREDNVSIRRTWADTTIPSTTVVVPSPQSGYRYLQLENLIPNAETFRFLRVVCSITPPAPVPTLPWSSRELSPSRSSGIILALLPAD